uniref:Uncharacterized protein n=1 Tax=Micrurus lemniscatus lemniscatus TaxID=129467 RepID=A0A2D4H898_MICLE
MSSAIAKQNIAGNVGQGGSHFINHRRQMTMGEAEERARCRMSPPWVFGQVAPLPPSLPKLGSSKFISRFASRLVPVQKVTNLATAVEAAQVIVTVVVTRQLSIKLPFALINV